MGFTFDDNFFKANFAPQFQKIDICGLVKKLKHRSTKRFTITRETEQLHALIENPPTVNDCYKLLSVSGGFSSIAIIKYIAEKEGIKELYASTFRIGHKQFETMNRLHNNGKLEKAHLITSTTQKNTDKDYNYYERILAVCELNKWDLKVFNNHSKLILMQTAENWYVVETSSNLNENPKIEQFSWENNKELYEWYRELFIELMKEETE